MKESQEKKLEIVDFVQSRDFSVELLLEKLDELEDIVADQIFAVDFDEGHTIEIDFDSAEEMDDFGEALVTAVNSTIFNATINNHINWVSLAERLPKKDDLFRDNGLLYYHAKHGIVTPKYFAKKCDGEDGWYWSEVKFDCNNNAK